MSELITSLLEGAAITEPALGPANNNEGTQPHVEHDYSDTYYRPDSSHQVHTDIPLRPETVASTRASKPEDFVGRRQFTPLTMKDLRESRTRGLTIEQVARDPEILTNKLVVICPEGYCQSREAAAQFTRRGDAAYYIEGGHQHLRELSAWNRVVVASALSHSNGIKFEGKVLINNDTTGIFSELLLGVIPITEANGFTHDVKLNINPVEFTPPEVTTGISAQLCFALNRLVGSAGIEVMSVDGTDVMVSKGYDKDTFQGQKVKQSITGVVIPAVGVCVIKHSVPLTPRSITQVVTSYRQTMESSDLEVVNSEGLEDIYHRIDIDNLPLHHQPFEAVLISDRAMYLTDVRGSYPHSSDIRSAVASALSRFVAARDNKKWSYL